MRLCNYCQAGMAVLPTLEIGKYIFCDAECASKRIAELQAKLETVTALARIKYGNLDADVDAVLTSAEKLIASLKESNE